MTEMTLADRMYAAFGETDFVFAGHPSDEEQAFRLLTEFRSEKIGWAEVSDALDEYLQDRSVNNAHAAEQIERAEKYFRPWLLD